MRLSQINLDTNQIFGAIIIGLAGWIWSINIVVSILQEQSNDHKEDIEYQFQEQRRQDLEQLQFWKSRANMFEQRYLNRLEGKLDKE